jgi:hypothetical protein
MIVLSGEWTFRDFDREETVKRAIFVGAIVILAASSVAAQNIYFTGTVSNQIWVANKDGSGSPAVLFDSATSGSRGPVGIVVVLEAIQTIFYSGGNNWEIDVANVDGSGTPSVLWANTCCEHLGVTADVAGGVLYWTTENAGEIRSGNMDGSGSIGVVHAGLPSSQYPVGITYASGTDALYWTSVSGDSIIVGNADGSGTPTVLFDSGDGVSGPRQIVVDEGTGTLYWTQHTGPGSTGQIMAGNADGSGTPAELFSISSPHLPYGIDIDAAAGTLYWTEFEAVPNRQGDRIMTGNADGSGTPAVLFEGVFGSVRGIAAGVNLIPVELMDISVE